MTAAATTLPFGVDPVEEVPLSRAPLVKVIAQIQFPRLSALRGGEEMAVQYASLIRDEYPILNEQHALMITITPEGATQQPGPSKVWVLQSSDGDWTIGLGDSSLSLETTNYVNRADFCQRLGKAVAPLIDLVNLPYLSRLGIRYVNRIDELADVQQLPTLFEAPVNAILSATLPSHVRVDQTLSQTIYHVDPADGLLARWGLLPANAVVDPTITPTPAPSFLFDLDAFRQYSDRKRPNADRIAADAIELAERAYRYFRSSVTPNFLERYGATAR